MAGQAEGWRQCAEEGFEVSPGIRGVEERFVDPLPDATGGSEGSGGSRGGCHLHGGHSVIDVYGCTLLVFGQSTRRMRKNLLM